MAGESSGWQMPDTWQQPNFFGNPQGFAGMGLGNPGSYGPNAVNDQGFQSTQQLMGGLTNPAQAGGLAGAGSWGSSGLGMNIGTGQLALSGLGTMANLWTGMQAASMAKKQFEFQKATTQTNLANQLKTYNTALADRSRVRGIVEGQSPDQVNGYVAANRL